MRRHRAHAVGHARQTAEEARQLGIDALGDVAIGGEQGLLVGEVEARVGAQEAHEVGHRALPAGGAHRLVGGGADARDLGEPELVDLFGRHLRRRRDARAVRVPGGAVGERRHAERRARVRHVLLDDELLERAQRHVDVLDDCFACGGLQAGGVCGRDARRQVREGELVDGALGRIIRDLVADALAEVLERHARRRDAALEPLAQERDVLVDELRIGVDAREEVLEVERVAPRDRGRQIRQRRVHAAHLVDGEELVGKALPFHVEAGVAQVQIVVELLCARQPRAINRAEPLDDVATVRLAPLDGRERVVGQLVVVARVADERGPGRKLAHLPFPVLVEEGGKALVLVGSGRRGGAQSKEDGKDEGATHGAVITPLAPFCA